MKTEMKITLLRTSLLMLLLLPQTARCFYNPSTGRWLSRDPIGEQGGVNLYEFAANDPLDEIDARGMCVGCDVKSFKITSQKWVGGWPSFTLGGRRYTKQLETKFELVLKPGSDKSCCRIRQNKKGRVTTASGRAGDDFPSWTADLGDWWNGSAWTIGLPGKWSGSTAVFTDAPGFNQLVKSDFPVYYGSEVGPGTFDFNTYVIDACKPGHPRVGDVFWGLYRDCT